MDLEKKIEAHEECYIQGPRRKTKDRRPIKECIEEEKIQCRPTQCHGSWVERELYLGPCKREL